jgi:hypothetical protein
MMTQIVGMKKGPHGQVVAEVGIVGVAQLDKLKVPLKHYPLDVTPSLHVRHQEFSSRRL